MSTAVSTWFIDEFGDGFNRHSFSQSHDNVFKQQRETAAGSVPWDINQQCSAIVAFDLRRSGCQIDIMLKKVQMTSDLFLGIICVYARLLTLRAGKDASPGIVFRSSVRMRIAEMLAEDGVDELDAGIPAMGAGVRRELSSLISRRLTKPDKDMAQG